MRELFSSKRVRYVSTETMMNEFVDAMRSKGMPGFKRRYREVDVLLVDDIQFLERTEQLQEEFFYTFNDLHGRGSQIVISSDRPPKSIATIEDRLRSRFEWGLITDIQPPEFETRLAILRKKAESEHLDGIPDAVLGVHRRERRRQRPRARRLTDPGRGVLEPAPRAAHRRRRQGGPLRPPAGDAARASSRRS